jgi:uncharacterized protein (TIGR02145 family)
MAQNLNYAYKLPESGADSISFCYKNDPVNCEKYGRMYTWMAAIDSAALFSEKAKGCGYWGGCSLTYPVRGVCPTGWHIPTEAEWNSLFVLVNDWREATIWFDSPNGKDAYGFSAIPAGYSHSGGYYYSIDDEVEFWSSSEVGNGNALVRAMELRSGINRATLLNTNKTDAISVRCLMDGTISETSSTSTKPTSSNNLSVVSDTLIDSRDGQVYRTVKIGYQWWMAENLNYETEGSYCYNDSAEYCAKYGRLYTQDAVKNKGCATQLCRGICPEGWYLPNDDDFAVMRDVVNSYLLTYKLKSTYGWYNDLNGTDDYGFTALPAGFRDENGAYDEIGKRAIFWRLNEYAVFRVFNLYYDQGRSAIQLENFYKRDYALSVRCVK